MLASELKRRRRSQGLCLDCGRPTGGRLLCEKHQARKRQYQHARRRGWVKRGLCPDCGRETGGHYRCPHHNAAHNASMVQTREAWKLQGRCRHCGRSLEPLGDDWDVTSCPVCQDSWDEQRRNATRRR